MLLNVEWPVVAVVIIEGAAHDHPGFSATTVVFHLDNVDESHAAVERD